MKTTRRNFIQHSTLGASGMLFGALGFPFEGCSTDSMGKKPNHCSIVFKNGEAKIKIGEQLFDPLAFRSFRPEPYNIRDFYNAGVRLMSIFHSGMPCTLGVPYSQYGENWVGMGKYDFSKIDTQMKVFFENAPDAYFNIKLMLDTRPWYLEMNPGLVSSYRYFSSMAGNEKWRKDATQYLRDVVGYLEEKYGDRIFAYSLFAGSSTEWYTEMNYAARGNIFLEEDGSRKPLEYLDIDRFPVKMDAWRKWLGDSSVSLPTLQSLEQTSHGVFRDLSVEEDRKSYDYWQFHNKIIGEAACHFSKVVKDITDNKKLTGLFYGYLTLLSGRRLLCNGHLGFEQVWNSPYFDMIYGPTRYETRKLTDASGYLVPVDSVALRNKLYFQEIDYRFAKGEKRILENGQDLGRTHPEEMPVEHSKSCIRREFINTLEKRTGMWWFDFFGYNYIDPVLMGEVKETMAVREKIRDIEMVKISEIAIFTDAESEFYLHQDSDLDAKNIARQITEFTFLGAPHDSFTLSDLERACDQKNYKMIFFLNAFKIPGEKLAYINQKLKKDGRYLVFLYAPGYITDEGFSVENMSSLLGMNMDSAMKPSGKIILDATLKKELEGTTFGYDTEVAPEFFIGDEKAAVYGKYEDGNIAFASKDFDGYSIWYAGAGTIPSGVLREMARKAGVHLYYEGNDPVYVNSRMVGIHHVRDEEAVILMPCECSGEMLFGGERVQTTGKRLNLKLQHGEMNAVLLDQPLKV